MSDTPARDQFPLFRPEAPPPPVQPGSPCPTAGCPGRLKADGLALYCSTCKWRGWRPTPHPQQGAGHVE